MCSYLAMFPPSLPRYFIEHFSRPGDTVLDPFAGRGTTPLEACLAGRIGAGSDLNPLASVLTAAKVNPATLDEGLGRVSELRDSYRRLVVAGSAPRDIAMLFDGRRTLPQLLHVRNSLSLRRRVDRHLLACLCGILHGNHPSEPRSSRTLSISMPNTFSMSPDYIRRFKRQRGLRKYPLDVFDALEKRLRYLHRQLPPDVPGRAARRDARRVDQWFPKDSVSLVVTSPPYLRVVRYGKFNWIRLWLLGHSIEAVDRIGVEATDKKLRLVDNIRFPAYSEFLRAVLGSCYTVVKPGGMVVLVIGDVTEPSGATINLAWSVWKEIRRSIGFEFVDLLEDPIETHAKVTRIWGSTRGRATKTDRILVLKKPGARRYRAKRPETVLSEMLLASPGVDPTAFARPFASQ